ncbi:MAG: hypothetical protein NTX49_06725 [Chlamydiae bacterium]|nr:hypothetical protein [Chlamydiota bacterium]
MKTLLSAIFFNHWQRKAVSLILAIIIWLVVNHSLTSTKTIANVPVRIISVPSGKTIEGMQASGRLNKRLTLSLVGNKTLLEELNSNDLEVVIDASNKSDEWIATISKKNLISLNPEIDISKGISRVYHPNFIIRLTKLVTEKIPIIITQPIGEAPRGYQFLDVWPYRLTLSVSGPEEVIKRLALKEQRLTFNLNDISKGQLDAIASGQTNNQNDVVSYFVPDQWKQINIPLLSDAPLEIDDVQAKALRIDFVRCNLLALDSPVLVATFFPPEFSDTINPDNYKIEPNLLVQSKNGIYMINTPLFAKGVDRLFIEVVKNMIQIVVIAEPPTKKLLLDWSVQFVNTRLLEDAYVARLISDTSDEDLRMMKPNLREEYLRNRFRSYMNRFQLFTEDDEKFSLEASLENNKILITQEASQEKSPTPPKK